MQIKDGVFMVTGGASGLGEGTVRMLSANGASVVIADLQADKGEALAKELGAKVRFVKCDVTSESDGQAAVDAAQRNFGGLQGLVNCAGIAIAERTVKKDGAHGLASFARVIGINLIGTFNMIRLAAVAMAKFSQVPERYLYVPSIGLALLVGDLVAVSLSSQRRLVRLSAPVAVGLATLIGFVRLEARLPDWRSDGALFAAALRVNPEDVDANLSLGIEAGRRGDWAEAGRALALAQRTDPHSGRIATALAWVLLRSGDVAGGVRQAERATTMPPYQPDAWYYLALARHEAGDHPGELSAIERLLELSPDYPRARGSRAFAACEVSGRSRCVEAARQAEAAP